MILQQLASRVHRLRKRNRLNIGDVRALIKKSPGHFGRGFLF
jgi:hypothetical protein